MLSNAMEREPNQHQSVWCYWTGRISHGQSVVPLSLLVPQGTMSVTISGGGGGDGGDGIILSLID